ncbi:MAG TPA: hypothetical protein VFS43_19620 [Polyangiaceae bacterium]|nr:hypothetical protein [Polyangiaceae bacterium]
MKALAGLAALALVACSGGSPSSGGPAPAGSCAKVGASCQFAPGKLGVCSADERPRDCGGAPCTGDPPLVCVSLH